MNQLNQLNQNFEDFGSQSQLAFCGRSNGPHFAPPAATSTAERSRPKKWDRLAVEAEGSARAVQTAPRAQRENDMVKTCPGEPGMPGMPGKSWVNMNEIE